MDLHPPDHCLIHSLPSAPQFVGREPELDELLRLWRSNARGVVALVGLGGAGKTAIAARFVEEIRGLEIPLRPAGLFVWSFYQEPDAGYFLRELYQYFGQPNASSTPAKGAALLHLLGEALAGGGAHMIVLDGLERVQRPDSDGTGQFGQLEDPLLKALLSRVVDGVGQTLVLVTSRFPLTDLKSAQGHGYHHVNVEGLSASAASALLRHHGVRGDDETFANLIESYGAHALTLDHLGGLIGQFLEGDPGRAPEAPALALQGQDRQALRLARLLNAYAEHLPAAELALLCRLCHLQRSIKLEQLLPLFLCSPAVHFRTARDLEGLIQRIPIADEFPDGIGPELAVLVREAIAEALQHSPIAGPDHVFQENMRLAIEQILDQHAKNVENDIEELIRVYDKANFDVSTEQRPLPWQDQERLREAFVRHDELRNHPLLPFKEPPAKLQLAFLYVGWGKPSRGKYKDLAPADVMHSFRRVRRALQRFAIKHLVLRRVHEICRLYQQKWQAGGPLAALDAQSLVRALDALVGRHLALRDAVGSISVHPAVRDYFGHLATASERGFWHDLIGEQLISLVRRPGMRLPTDQASLDLVEDAISHAIEAGHSAKARKLYTEVLGGHRHLAWKLGEMARGLRIMRCFNPCLDRWALGWYLRALGELDEAFQQNNLPFFRADIRLLQGRLSEVAREGDPARAAIAEFLMGKGSLSLPPDPLGCAIPRAQILYYAGRFADASLAGQPERLYEMIGWEDDRARCTLVRAEMAARMGDRLNAQRSLEDAAQWILHSGSVEHLCLYHLIRARIAIQANDTLAARVAVDEGLHGAVRCGLMLYRVELLCVQADIWLNHSRLSAAEQFAREALVLAESAESNFIWGAMEAGQLLGRSLLAQNRVDEAKPILYTVLSRRLRLGDPRATDTRKLIDSIKP